MTGPEFADVLGNDANWEALVDALNVAREEQPGDEVSRWLDRAIEILRAAS